MKNLVFSCIFDCRLSSASPKRKDTSKSERITYLVINTVFEVSSQSTLQPKPSADALAGTMVLSFISVAGTSRYFFSPFTKYSERSIVIVIFVSEVFATTFFEDGSHETSAPRASKIALMGTRVLPSFITGYWSGNKISFPLSLTLIS